jgi:aryl-alcohol dehydrogenase-like predicted oxidoreductase
VVKEALANGELAAGDSDGVRMAAAAAGLSPDSFAIGAARAQAGVDIVLSGAATRTQLRRGVDAPAARVDDATRRRLAVDPDLYWRRRSERPWG